MILIGNILVSDELFDVDFHCNLSQCKGACCIEGDSGAPITHEEKENINSALPSILPLLPETNQNAIREMGFAETDWRDNEFVTQCLPDGMCVFAQRNKWGILSCAIEEAHNAGLTNIQKPLSCHLYPIRVSKVGEYTALNYHKWDICSAACSLGKEKQMPVFRFLKNALIRSYGTDFYNELEEVYVAYKAEK